VQVIDGHLVCSASDLVGFLLCPHLTGLELAAADGDLARPERADPELDVLTRRGGEHEGRYLEQLRARGVQVVEISVASEGADALRAAHSQTAAAIAEGVPVIYQATFYDGEWRGHADFLERIDRPGAVLGWGYEPVDTKLARRVKPSALIQLCVYADMLAAVQGSDPEQIHVVTGDGERHSFPLDFFAAYYRHARWRFREAVASGLGGTYPHPVAHCRVCRWDEMCSARRWEDDHLSLVAGMRGDQAKKLAAAGITTTEALAGAPPGDPASVRIGSAALERLRSQARLQADYRQTGAPRYELLLPTEPDRGLRLLPEPSPGDVFFDIEGDPFAGDDGLDYLLGVVEVDGKTRMFRAYWAHDSAQEKRAFEYFMDAMTERLERCPGMHIYHYASYEPTALKRLMGRHGTREAAVDRLLRGGVLVDLYQVVRQAMQVSEDSYSLKRIERFFRPSREGAVTDAAASIVAYEHWLESGDPSVLDDIESYNRQDCESLVDLRDWLEALRDEAAACEGVVLSRPAAQHAEPSAAQAEAEADVADLAERLAGDGLGAAGEGLATSLLANLLSWHRREDKPEWWAHFARLRMSDDELLDEPESLSGLAYRGEVGRVARSVLHGYAFPPEQEHKFAIAATVHDPRTEKSCGTIHEIDAADGVLVLKRSATSSAPHPSAVIPAPPVSTVVLRQALQRMGEWVADHGVSGDGPWRAGRELLLRNPPDVEGSASGEPLRREGEPDVNAALRVVEALHEGCLPIQGPPGCGKTYVGGRVVVDQVARGRRVGVTATSHKAIGRLLEEVQAASAERGQDVRIVQKADDDDACGLAGVHCTNDNKEVVDLVAAGEVDVVAGTPWLFARGDLGGALDVLVIDEAGQMSLANAVAVSGAARKVVMLGDPNQLAQPSRGTHPPGAGVSALEHLLAGDVTVRPERGLFLSTTRRMHPDVGAFVSAAFYEGRVVSHESCGAQAVADGPWAGGTGVRWVPVRHAGNRSTSAEEVEEVARGVGALLGREWTDASGTRRALAIEDILIVAPYNAHIARLRSVLPDGARVGTVDRFQGQEAPVVIFSMATSSAEDLPRAMEFLFSLNRLNVAVSRARALAVLVCSPELLAAACRTPGQMKLVNALCRLVEYSG
jgi:uncharacterized protein